MTQTPNNESEELSEEQLGTVAGAMARIVNNMTPPLPSVTKNPTSPTGGFTVFTGVPEMDNSPQPFPGALPAQS